MRRSRTVVAAAVLPALLACAGAKRAGRAVEQELNPFASARVAVVAVAVHGPYLVADIQGASGGRGDLTLLAPGTDPACLRILRPEAWVTYRKHGHFGRFEDGEDVCDAVGVASLAAWRDRQPRGPLPRAVIPRATVRFREIARDDDVVLVRGRFPLVGHAGIPAGHDLVALLPTLPACARPLERGEGSLEFVPAGRVAFRIVGDGGPCPVLGFALPLPPTPPAGAGIRLPGARGLTHPRIGAASALRRSPCPAVPCPAGSAASTT